MANLNELTADQLKAMGLTDEQIKGILGVKDATSGGGANLPFPIVKRNDDPEIGSGAWLLYNAGKDDDGNTTYDFIIKPPFKIRFLKSYFQYSKWDNDTKKITVSSNIFASSREGKNAYDLLTGQKIATLRETDPEIKQTRISLVEVYDDKGNAHTAIFFIRRSYLGAMNQILWDIENEGHLNKIITLNHKKQKNGAVVYFVPELVEIEDYDFLSTIKEDSEKIAKFDKWVEDVNKNGSSEPSISNEQEIDDEDDDINFD